MKLLANIVAGAVLLLLVGSGSASAEPGPVVPGQPRPRPALTAAVPPRRESRQNEAAEENDDEVAGNNSNTLPLWYRMLPAAQGEQGAAEQLLIPGLKEGWEAVSGQVSKINPEQLKEVALAQMKRLRTSAAVDEQYLKLPPALQNMLNDPETRRSFAQFALGALGMTAAGIALGDAGLIRDLSLVALYVAALTQFLRGGVQLAGKVAAEAGEVEGIQKSKSNARHMLAKLLGARAPDSSKPESERLDEQDLN